MTNTEMWLDETISHIKSVKSDIWMLHEIMSLPNCNDCKNKDCEYKPKWGEHIRYNCPLHNADRKTENSSEKPNNCEDEQTEETCERCVYVRGSQWCQGCNGTPKRWDGEKIVDTPQTEICDTCKYRSSNVFGNWCVGRDTCDRYEADTPQTDCETCKYGQDKHRYAHICNECGVGINNYTPQTERSG